MIPFWKKTDKHSKPQSAQKRKQNTKPAVPRTAQQSIPILQHPLPGCFATKRNPPRFSKSEHILGLCCVCVKNGWFYFMRTFTNGEYYFRFFLPREAFSSCSAEEGQLALRKHLPFYMDRDTLQANLVILCFFCLCAAAGWKEGILIAVLVVLWIYIFQAFVYLPLIVRKMIKEHTFYALSEPSKLSLYHAFRPI